MTTEYLLNRELEHVLAALTPTNELVARVCLHTGLRVSDVLALRSDQLRRRFTVVESKTGKRRTVTLPDVLLRRLQAESGEKYVFEGRYGPDTHRTRQAVYADIKRSGCRRTWARTRCARCMLWSFCASTATLTRCGGRSTMVRLR